MCSIHSPESTSNSYNRHQLYTTNTTHALHILLYRSHLDTNWLVVGWHYYYCVCQDHSPSTVTHQTKFWLFPKILWTKQLRLVDYYKHYSSMKLRPSSSMTVKNLSKVSCNLTWSWLNYLWFQNMIIKEIY